MNEAERKSRRAHALRPVYVEQIQLANSLIRAEEEALRIHELQRIRAVEELAKLESDFKALQLDMQ